MKTRILLFFSLFAILNLMLLPGEAGPWARDRRGLPHVSVPSPAVDVCATHHLSSIFPTNYENDIIFAIVNDQGPN